MLHLSVTGDRATSQKIIMLSMHAMWRSTVKHLPRSQQRPRAKLRRQPGDNAALVPEGTSGSHQAGRVDSRQFATAMCKVWARTVTQASSLPLMCAGGRSSKGFSVQHEHIMKNAGCAVSLVYGTSTGQLSRCPRWVGPPMEAAVV